MCHQLTVTAVWLCIGTCQWILCETVELVMVATVLVAVVRSLPKNVTCLWTPVMITQSLKVIWMASECAGSPR